ncbi:MAG: hypothetical protein QOE36_434 [Gaiellaceae bacterium]|nr:hypothetical protein [Gaiellaceae bacterium]
MLADARRFTRLALGLRSYLREPVDAEAHRARLRTHLEGRTESFLHVLCAGVFGNPKSPYLPLLARAGAEQGDIEKLVKAEGLEGALGRLWDDGVRVGLDEFKGRAPEFDNLLFRSVFEARSGGSGGTRRPAKTSLDQLRHQTAYQWLFLEAFDAHERPLVIWRPVPPGRAGLWNALRSPKTGRPADRWFTQTPYRLASGLLRDWPVTRLALALSRRYAAGLPTPEHVPPGDAIRVARRVAELVAAGTPPLLDTLTSSAVRVCLAAEASGLDVSGTLIRVGSEALTPAKAEAAVRVGARIACHYSMAEAGRMAMACADAEAVDDVHLLEDKIAVVQRERPVGAGESVGALYLTTLLPHTSKLMLNVESGDYANITDRDCGCALGALGFRRHLHGIRSYEKLSTEGMHFLGPELVRLVEETLPARFGGGPTDYQLVEEEGLGGLPQVSLVVSPRVGVLDEGAVVAAALAALGDGPGYKRMMAELWRDGSTLQVVRREPHVTAAAKILPLHLVRR